MVESTFTFRVDEELKSAFAEFAKAQDRTGAQLLRDFMRNSVKRQQEAAEHDAWFRREVEQALREANDPNTEWISNDEVRAGWQARQAELLKRAGSK